MGKLEAELEEYIKAMLCLRDGVFAVNPDIIFKCDCPGCPPHDKRMKAMIKPSRRRGRSLAPCGRALLCF